MAAANDVDGERELESHLDERRVFPPPRELQARARVRSMEEYQQLRRRALEDPEGFWSAEARTLDWIRPWSRFFEKESPFCRFFVGGQLNLSANCLDRHLAARGDKPAIVWEGE